MCIRDRRDAAGELRPAGDISEIGQYYAALFGGLNLREPRYRRLRESITGDFAPGSGARDPQIVPVNAFIGVYLRLETLFRMGEHSLMLRDIEDFFGQMEAYTCLLYTSPSRERAGWLCDSYFTGRTEYALFGCTPTERCV